MSPAAVPRLCTSDECSRCERARGERQARSERAGHPSEATMDRCDRCPAYALETWMHQVTGVILRFCGHHSRQWQVPLYQAGFRLVEATKVPA